MPVAAWADMVGIPARPLAIPGTTNIVAIPVAPRGEGDERDVVSGRSNVEKRHVAARAIEGEIFAEHPAPVAVPKDFAPGFIIQTSHDLNVIPLGDHVDSGKVDIRTGPEIHVSR